MSRMDKAFAVGLTAYLAVLVLCASGAIIRFARESVIPRRAGGKVAEANWLASEGHYETALQFYDDTLAFDPDNLGALQGRARVCSEMGDFEQAVAALEKAAQAHPEDAATQVQLGSAYMALQAWEPALAAFRAALAAAPNRLVPPYRKIAEIYVCMGQFDEAVAALREGIARAPQDLETHLTNLLQARRAGLQGEERAAIERMLRPEAIARLAKEYDAERVLAGVRQEQVSRLYFDLGTLLTSRAGCSQEALEAFDAAIALDPRYGEAYHNRGLAAWMAGRIDQARADLERAADLGCRVKPELWAAVHAPQGESR